MRIGSIVEKWQQHFELQDGGGRHLEVSEICIFDLTVAFYVRFSTFPPNLVRTRPIVNEWLQIFEIQDSGGSHLEKYTSGGTASMGKALPVCNFQSKLKVLWS